MIDADTSRIDNKTSQLTAGAAINRRPFIDANRELIDGESFATAVQMEFQYMDGTTKTQGTGNCESVVEKAGRAAASGDEGRGRRSPQPEEPASGDFVAGVEDGSANGACPSITHHKTRQEVSLESQELPAVLAIDWWESAGCVVHGQKSEELFRELDRCQQMAELHRQAYPANLGDPFWLVHSGGMGSGRGARFEYRLEYLGATIGVSARKDATRQLANFYIKIPGDSCLIQGARTLRDAVVRMLDAHDVTIMDEWFRRLDICLDLPGCDWTERWAGPCEAKQYYGTARQSAPYRDGSDTTGLRVWTSDVGLVIYDKQREVMSRKSEAYRQSMVQSRWGGVVPTSATRIEYQVRRNSFNSLGLSTVDEVLRRLPDVITRLTRFEDHPFFVLTDVVPDREGRHQGRASVLPTWRHAIEQMRQLSGELREPLKRLDRKLMTCTRCMQNVIGYLLTAAAQLDLYVENKDDLHLVFDELMRRNTTTDEDLRRKWEDKARRAGTLPDLTSFDFGRNLAL